MTRPMPRFSSPSSREPSAAPNRFFRVLTLAVALLPPVCLPVEGQIAGRLPGAGLETLGALSGADLETVASPSERSFTITCAGEDPSCRTPEIRDLATVTSEINISRTVLEALQLTDCKVIDLNVAVELEHTFVNDLELRLERASGPDALLLGQGAGSDLAEGDRLDVLFDDQQIQPPGTRRVARPVTPLSVFDGQDVAGVWRLRIVDRAPGDSGRLIDWGFTYTVDCRVGLPPTNCVADGTTLCLSNDRFRVTVGYRTSGGQTGSGRAVELTDDTGYVWFFDRSNVEAVVKVLNACSFADHFWVFAAGLTNVEVDIVVFDTQSGDITAYRNGLNKAFEPIQDTASLDSCP